MRSTARGRSREERIQRVQLPDPQGRVRATGGSRFVSQAVGSDFGPKAVALNLHGDFGDRDVSGRNESIGHLLVGDATAVVGSRRRVGRSHVGLQREVRVCFRKHVMTARIHQAQRRHRRELVEIKRHPRQHAGASRKRGLRKEETGQQ